MAGRAATFTFESRTVAPKVGNAERARKGDPFEPKAESLR